MLYRVVFCLILLLSSVYIYAAEQDTIRSQSAIQSNETTLDSLKANTPDNELTKFLFKLLSNQKDSLNNDTRIYSQDYYDQFQGKKIIYINIKSFGAFQKHYRDTTTSDISWYKKLGKSLHTKTNANSLKKLLLFEEHDTVTTTKFYESERIIRSLPYIKSVRIFFSVNKNNPEEVGVYVITRDRFSWGVSGDFGGLKTGRLEIYNKNVFGRGHEISTSLVGSRKRKPHLGYEVLYSIPNINGNFISTTVGFKDHYYEKGVSFIIDKPFLTPSIKWGYNFTANRMKKAYKITPNHPILIEEPLDLTYLNGWIGRNFTFNNRGIGNYQITASTGFYRQHFYKRPVSDDSNKQYFSNSMFYLVGLTFSQRNYVQDALVYNYGIIEDIPEGFKKELVVGYDDNEFGSRYYAHLYLANGNILKKRLDYLNISGGYATFFNKNKLEQGLIQANINYISRLYKFRKNRYRLFIDTRYFIGTHRFEIEDLHLHLDNHIRGFRSKKPAGKQRLSVNLESVFFLNKQFYGFNMAVFGFNDLGIIGSNKKSIFSGSYYDGFGFGLRVHNENLVFRTLQLRFAFYPLAPSDVSFFKVLIDEQNKRRFYDYQPIGPTPLRYE